MMYNRSNTLPVILMVCVVLAVMFAVVYFQKSAVSIAPHQRIGSFVGTNNIDPDDFCKELNKALTAAGAKMKCYGSVYERVSNSIAAVRWTNAKGETMIRMDVGVDNSDTFKYYGVPQDKLRSVFTISVKVYSDFENNGLGSTIVRNCNTFLKLLGAKVGDVNLLIASPDLYNMPQGKIDAWIQFVKDTCAELGGTQLVMRRSYGCWMFVK